MTPSDPSRSEWHAAAHPGPAAIQGNLAAALAQVAQPQGFGAAWRRGWSLVAAGRFGEAWEALSACGSSDTPYGAAAGLTCGSLLRQIGLHDRAEQQDTAVAAAAPAGSDQAAAAAIGLVADAVGQGADAADLEARLAAAGTAVAATGSPRQRIRMAWVAGEVAMVAGEPGLAEGRFNAAAEAAKGMRAQRHQAKSLAFLAAAQASLGQADTAIRTATSALTIAEDLGARPLQWAAHLVLADLEDPPRHRDQAQVLLASALEGLPDDVRAAALTRAPCRELGAG